MNPIRFARHRRRRRAAVIVGATAATALALSACMNGGGGGLFERKAPLTPQEQALLANPKVPEVVSAATTDSSIPVLVNDVPITAYDIDQRVRLAKIGGGKADKKSATEELIDETLEGLEAQRQNVQISDAQVSGAFAQIAQNVKMNPDQLVKALASQGIDAGSLKKRLKAQMTWQALVQQRTLQKATIKSQDVTAALSAKGDLDATITEYTVQPIVFVVPSGSPAGVYDQRRTEAQGFRQRYSGCDNGLDQAKQLRDVVVKPQERRDSSLLDGPQADILKNTAVGAATAPAQTPDGIVIMGVCAKRDIQSTAAARAEVENSLYLQQSADLGKDYLKELRDRAIIEYH